MIYHVKFYIKIILWLEFLLPYFLTPVYIIFTQVYYVSLKNPKI